MKFTTATPSDIDPNTTLKTELEDTQVKLKRCTSNFKTLQAHYDARGAAIAYLKHKLVTRLVPGEAFVAGIRQSVTEVLTNMPRWDGDESFCVDENTSQYVGVIYLSNDDYAYNPGDKWAVSNATAIESHIHDLRIQHRWYSQEALNKELN